MIKKIFLILCFCLLFSGNAYCCLKGSFYNSNIGNMTTDLEMGNTPYSIDGGTNGLVFDSNNDNTNEVVIDASGNVGIGETAPGAKFQTY